jgi:tripartite-type tricarboxylate transporter receptor subunit TctC
MIWERKLQGTSAGVLLIVSLICAAFSLETPAHAESWPVRPIRLIIAAAAGGPNDLPARIASEILSPKLGQPVVVEYQPGAGGAIGARVAAHSKPDGSTLFVGNTSTLAAIPAVSRSAGYDPVGDFVPIGKIAEGFLVLAVNPASPWKTVDDFVRYAKANPGKINYAHSGRGSLPNLAGESFMLHTGTQLTGVPYRSGGESITAVLSQTVEATFENNVLAGSLAAGGKLRVLAVLNKTRMAVAPDVPTIAEAGYAGAEANTFFGLVAPVGTPAAIVTRLNTLLNEGLENPEIKATLIKVGLTVQPCTPIEFAAFIASQHQRWLEVGKAANISIE